MASKSQTSTPKHNLAAEGPTGKSVLRYPGGKTRAVKIILPMIEAQGATTLISPFFGGGSVELAWAHRNPAGQVQGTDLYPPVATFWQYALTDPSALAEMVQPQHPISKTEFYELQKRLHTLKGGELAAAFYVLNRASFSGSTMSGGMSPGHTRFTQSSIERLRSFRAPNVTVAEGNVFDVLSKLESRSPTNLAVYLDPPYRLDDSVLYGEQGSTHRRFDHEALASHCQRLAALGHRLLMSYNDDPSIRALYKGFEIAQAAWAYGMKNVSGTPMGGSSEILITSPSWSTIPDED